MENAELSETIRKTVELHQTIATQKAKIEHLRSLLKRWLKAHNLKEYDFSLAQETLNELQRLT